MNKELILDYIQYEVVTSKLNFDSAIKHCKNKGGDLATPSSSLTEKNIMAAILQKDLKDPSWSSNTYIWINLNKGYNNKLINGQSYINFGPGEGTHPYQNCVAIKNKKWADEHCHRTYAFVCEYTKARMYPLT